jgi:hypothetical protein
LFPPAGADDESKANALLLRRRFRDSLRSARAKVHADAEGFEVVVHAIERLGRHLNPQGDGLAKYHDALIALVEAAELKVGDLEHRLFLLRQTRNDAAHQGSYARNAAREAVHVALRLEEALTVCWADIEVQHLMVRGAITAQPGDTLGDVRRAMLEHAFTAIPAFVEKRWCLITDRWLAAELAGKNKGPREAVLQRKVAELSDDEVTLLAVVAIQPSTRVSSLAGAGHLQHALTLVARDADAGVLEGVVAPADLL